MTYENQETNTYTISLEDIRAYLATKQDDETVGVTIEGDVCLAANTLKHKYPGADVGVAWYNAGARINDTFIKFPEDVTQVANTFDNMERREDYRDGTPITKAQLRERMPELFTTEG